MRLVVRMRMQLGIECWAGFSLAMLLLGAHAVSAAPLDLRDTRSRAVTVRFENSPADAPERLASVYTAEIPARFDSEPATGHVRVRIAGRDVERDYFRRQPLRAGSFSDYVWVFDPRTGHVVSASLSGTLIRRFAIGPLGKEVDTHFEARLSTMQQAGFAGSRRILGQLVFPFCRDAVDGCQLVRAARYDARTGYVNAVGSIGGTALGMSASTFAAIGEAIFSERGGSAPEDYADTR